MTAMLTEASASLGSQDGNSLLLDLLFAAVMADPGSALNGLRTEAAGVSLNQDRVRKGDDEQKEPVQPPVPKTVAFGSGDKPWDQADKACGEEDFKHGTPPTLVVSIPLASRNSMMIADIQ